MAATISGDQSVWGKTVLDFKGPTLSEAPATFRDYRLDVTFTNETTGEVVRVPGYFAADGDAADTGAASGDVWRVNFNPPSIGEWRYEASFRTGTDIAASTDPNAGTPLSFDGDTGAFDVASTTADEESFAGKGMILQDPGTHYLRHQGDGDYFIRGGPGVPENFLATTDFDNTADGRHDFVEHATDYAAGDPTWAGGQGQNIVGAVNYLAEQGQNTIYILTNTIGGDGQDVGPWVNPAIYDVGKNKSDLEDAADETDGLSVEDFSVYDVSKLAQWEILFDYMDEKGIYKNILFQETENDQLLDGGTPVDGSTLSVERLVYMREMIARFGHSNGVQWNLGEENTNSTAELEDMASFVKAVDAYDHLVVVHTFPGQIDDVYDPLLGYEDFDGPSFQTGGIRSNTIEYRDKSAEAGDPWVLAWDEDSGSNAIIPEGSNDPDSSSEQTQREKLWGHLTANGSGVNWYIKDQNAHSFDQNIDNFTSFQSLWTWTAAATEFFNTYIPFWEMTDDDDATPANGDYVMSKPGEYYVVYLDYGMATDASLDLSDYAGETFNAFWYDPRNGGDLVEAGAVAGGSVHAFGAPPNTPGKDWVLLVRNATAPEFPKAAALQTPPSAPTPQPQPLPEPEPDPEPPLDAEQIFLMEDGLVVIQAEDGAFLLPDAAGNDTWRLTNQFAGAKGDGVMLFDSTKDYFNVGNAGTPATGPLKYTFRIDGEDATGEYYITLRGIKPNTGEANDRNNDFFVATSEAGDEPGVWRKVFFSGGPNKFLWGQKYDVGHEKSPATFTVDGPGDYTIYISGRSRQAGLDEIHIQKGSANTNANAATSPSITDAPSPPTPIDVVDIEPDPIIDTPEPPFPADLQTREFIRYVGDALDNIMSGGGGDDLFRGQSGDDVGRGHSGDDALYGGDGRDILRGGAGDDVITGGGGDDIVLSGDKGDDVVLGGNGDDIIRGGADDDWLNGEGGDDRIIGDRGDDELYGGDGDDTLIGQFSEDVLDGGAGDDILVGGGDSDVFTFQPGAGRDVVRDFENGVDQIDLSTFDGLNFSDVQDAAQAAGSGGVLLNLSGFSETNAPSVIILRGVEVDDISADDFIL